MPEQTTPGTPSATHSVMSRAWEKIDAVLGGTESMRAKGETFLPRHARERQESYKERLSRSTLINVAQQTLDSWVGRPFSDKIQIDDAVPPNVQEMLKDVDLRGNDITVFAREWFREGLAKGLAHVLVDMPQGTPGVTRTMADPTYRPYWCLVRPENLIAATAEVIDGREVLNHVRITESETSRDGWGTKTKRRVRVFDRLQGIDGPLVFFSLYEKAEDKDEWVLIQDKTKLDVDYIPLVTFYADRKGLMLAKPPLEDLVDVNLAHWQSASDQRSILTVARFPILAASGVEADEADKVVLGPKRVLSTRDPSGKWYYVENTGASIAAGRQDLLDLEEQMAHYGAEFLKRRPGSQTATARALDSAEATSPLEDATVRFNDALSQAMDMTREWLGIDGIGKVEIVTDLGPDTVEAADFTALSTARATRDISRETLLAELKRRGVLADDFDPEVDQKLLEEESMAGPATLPTDTGATPFGK